MSTRQGHNVGYFGSHDLPQEQQDALRRAIRLERITVVVRIFTVAIIFALAGSSQAMKTAWIADALSFLPPLAFLVAIRFITRKPTPRHPYGYHRAMGVGHLVASISLLGLGTYLFIESGLALASGERPPIGMMDLFGTPVWAGWLMSIASVVVVIPSVFLGRSKMKLAPVLHNKVLYADAEMNKADWMTGVATGVGLLLVGAGLWWADAAAAIFISFGIIQDGIKNLRGSLAGLIDARATTVDSQHPEELMAKVREALLELDWVKEADIRLRDQGQVFHTEAFVVPHEDQMPSLAELETMRDRLSDMDWKLHDFVIIPVHELPVEFLPQANHHED